MNRELGILAGTTHRMSHGEMLQLEQRRNVEITEPEYMEIIERKTASLIAAACEIGAVLSDLATDETEPLVQYGENIGLAFQIKDDLFDFVGDQRVIGKPNGADVQSGWYTLPLIAAFKQAPSRTRISTPTARGRLRRGARRAAKPIRFLVDRPICQASILKLEGSGRAKLLHRFLAPVVSASEHALARS